MTSEAPQTGAADEPAEVADYVAAVRAALGDLPADTRHELLEDLPEHLTEVLAESGSPLVTRLGPPEAYAAELRAAAGAGSADRARSTAPARIAVLGRRGRERLERLDVRIGPAIGYASLTEFLRLLRPAWWLLRGYLAAMLFALLLNGDESLGLLPRVGDSDLLALLVLLGFVAGSVWLARQPRRPGRRVRHAVRGGTLVLAVVAFAGFLRVDSNARRSNFGEVYYDNDRYGHVEDVYVYDREGRLLSDVQLFDQDGQPIQLGDRYNRCDGQEPPVRPPAAGHVYPLCPEWAPYPGPVPDAVPVPAPPADPLATVPAATPSPPAASPGVAGTPSPGPTGPTAAAPSGTPTTDAPPAGSSRPVPAPRRPA